MTAARTRITVCAANMPRTGAPNTPIAALTTAPRLDAHTSRPNAVARDRAGRPGSASLGHDGLSGGAPAGGEHPEGCRRRDRNRGTGRVELDQAISGEAVEPLELGLAWRLEHALGNLDAQQAQLLSAGQRCPGLSARSAARRLSKPLDDSFAARPPLAVSRPGRL